LATLGFEFLKSSLEASKKGPLFQTKSVEIPL